MVSALDLLVNCSASDKHISSYIVTYENNVVFSAEARYQVQR